MMQLEKVEYSQFASTSCFLMVYLYKCEFSILRLKIMKYVDKQQAHIYTFIFITDDAITRRSYRINT